MKHIYGNIYHPCQRLALEFPYNVICCLGIHGTRGHCRHSMGILGHRGRRRRHGLNSHKLRAWFHRPRGLNKMQQTIGLVMGLVANYLSQNKSCNKVLGAAQLTGLAPPLTCSQKHFQILGIRPGPRLPEICSVLMCRLRDYAHSI